jgi:hypothetical protein
MFNSGVLDTVVGLVFVFLLVSMLVTIANELIAAMLLSRAKWLRIGIDRLLGSEWAHEIYAHPLIAGSASDGASGPSYIPSRSFANVLLDLVRRGDETIQTARAKLQKALDSPSAASPDELKTQVMAAAEALRNSAGDGAPIAQDLRRHLEKLSTPGLDLSSLAVDLEASAAKLSDPALESVQAALQHLAKLAPTGSVNDLRRGLQVAIDSLPYVVVADAIKKDLAAVLERLKDGYTIGEARADIQRFVDCMPARYLRGTIEKLPSEQVRKTLLVLLDDAENDIEKFKSNIEVWFNNAMDRVGGWYKRRSQWVIGALSLGITVAMNVDAILIIKHLNTDPGLRSALVAQATGFVASQPLLGTRPGSSGTSGSSAPSGDSAIPKALSGESFDGTLQFRTVPTGTGTVSLTSSSRLVTLRDQSVTVAAGAPSVKFTLDSKPLAQEAMVTIAASGAAEGTTTVQIDPQLDMQFRGVETRLMQLSLPIGWVRIRPSQQEIDDRRFLPAVSDLKGWGDTISFHVLGWLLTALSATLGAPFWFDTLNRFISIRSAGKAPEEKPKPPKDVPTPLEPGQSPQEADQMNTGKHR